MLDLHELVAGKLAALFGRTAARDVFDAHGLLGRADLDPTRLRLAFVAYGAMNRRDWRSVSTDELRLDPQGAERMLLPLLRGGVGPPRGEVAGWASALVERTRERLAAVLPLRSNEVEFLDVLLDLGEVRPELLTDDPALRDRLHAHPALLWKAQNVRAHRGSP